MHSTYRISYDDAHTDCDIRECNFYSFDKTASSTVRESVDSETPSRNDRHFTTVIMRTIVFLCTVAVTSAATWLTLQPEKPEEF
ncbi:hypothetical protein EVAR_92311_1, partial [Eumeta japonica]